MKSLSARRLLNRHCRHSEEWHCGRAIVCFTGKDNNPAFDRRLHIYLNQTPTEVDTKKIARLLRFLDHLSRGKECPQLTQPGKRATAKN